MKESGERQGPISPKILYEAFLQGSYSRVAESITCRYQKKLTEAKTDAQKQALREAIKTYREGLPRWVVSKRTSSGYFFLASYLGQAGKNGLFCTQYGEVLSGKVAENETPLVDVVREMSEDQIQTVLECLETNSKAPQPEKVVAPPGFYVFQFEAKDKEDRIMPMTEVVRNDSFREAVRELKRDLIYISPFESYQGFKIYREGRWESIETDPKTEVVEKDMLAKTRFRLFGQTEEFTADEKREEKEKYRFTLVGGGCNNAEMGEAYRTLSAAGVPFTPLFFNDYEEGYPELRGLPYLKDDLTGSRIAVGITEIEIVAQNERYLQEENQEPVPLYGLYADNSPESQEAIRRLREQKIDFYLLKPVDDAKSPLLLTPVGSLQGLGQISSFDTRADQSIRDYLAKKREQFEKGDE